MASNISRTVRFTVIALLATMIAGCSNAEPTSQRAGALAEVCSPTVAIQTDWYPQAEHGGIYELLGSDYVVDASAGTTTGALVVDGVDSGVDLQIRAGGPFIESPVVTEMFLDDTIMFGYVGTTLPSRDMQKRQHWQCSTHSPSTRRLFCGMPTNTRKCRPSPRWRRKCQRSVCSAIAPTCDISLHKVLCHPRK